MPQCTELDRHRRLRACPSPDFCHRLLCGAERPATRVALSVGVAAQVEAAGYEILRFEAPSIPVPYLASVLPCALWMQSQIDRLRKAPFFRSLGYGSIVVARKRPSESP